MKIVHLSLLVARACFAFDCWAPLSPGFSTCSVCEDHARTSDSCGWGNRSLPCYVSARQCCEDSDLIQTDSESCVDAAQKNGSQISVIRIPSLLFSKDCLGAVSVQRDVDNGYCMDLCNSGYELEFGEKCAFYHYHTQNGRVVVEGAHWERWIYGYAQENILASYVDGLFTETPAQCQLLCQEDSRCVRWQWASELVAGTQQDGMCMLKDKEMMEAALRIPTDVPHPPEMDTRFCNFGMPHLCSTNHYSCMKCSSRLRCVWESHLHVAGFKWNDGDSNQCDPAQPPPTFSPSPSTLSPAALPSLEETTSSIVEVSSTEKEPPLPAESTGIGFFPSEEVTEEENVSPIGSNSSAVSELGSTAADDDTAEDEEEQTTYSIGQKPWTPVSEEDGDTTAVADIADFSPTDSTESHLLSLPGVAGSSNIESSGESTENEDKSIGSSVVLPESTTSTKLDAQPAETTTDILLDTTVVDLITSNEEEQTTYPTGQRPGTPSPEEDADTTAADAEDVSPTVTAVHHLPSRPSCTGAIDAGSSQETSEKEQVATDPVPDFAASTPLANDTTAAVDGTEQEEEQTTYLTRQRPGTPSPEEDADTTAAGAEDVSPTVTAVQHWPSRPSYTSAIDAGSSQEASEEEQLATGPVPEPTTSTAHEVSEEVETVDSALSADFVFMDSSVAPGGTTVSVATTSINEALSGEVTFTSSDVDAPEIESTMALEISREAETIWRFSHSEVFTEEEDEETTRGVTPVLWQPPRFLV